MGLIRNSMSCFLLAYFCFFAKAMEYSSSKSILFDTNNTFSKTLLQESTLALFEAQNNLSIDSITQELPHILKASDPKKYLEKLRIVGSILWHQHKLKGFLNNLLEARSSTCMMNKTVQKKLGWLVVYEPRFLQHYSQFNLQQMGYIERTQEEIDTIEQHLIKQLSEEAIKDLSLHSVLHDYLPLIYVCLEAIGKKVEKNKQGSIILYEVTKMLSYTEESKKINMLINLFQVQRDVKDALYRIVPCWQNLVIFCLDIINLFKKIDWQIN